jgi:hypothetical protein
MIGLPCVAPRQPKAAAAGAINAGLSQAGADAQPEGRAKRSFFTQIELVKPDVNGAPQTIRSDRMSAGLACVPVSWWVHPRGK